MEVIDVQPNKDINKCEAMVRFRGHEVTTLLKALAANEEKFQFYQKDDVDDQRAKERFTKIASELAALKDKMVSP